MSDDEFDGETEWGEEWRTLGLVLDEFNYVEQILAGIITHYIAPRQDRMQWVERRLLNNLIIPFSAKVKLVTAISKELNGPKLNREHFDKIMATRNAMAHGHIFSALRRTPRPSWQELLDDPDVDLGGKSYVVVESITGSGEWKEVPRVMAVGEFHQIIDEQIKPALNAIINILEPPPR